MASEQQAPGLRKRMAPHAGSECLFWAAAVLLLFLFLGTAPLTGEEGRWAEGAREMLVTGDWTCARMNFENAPDIPLLPCWLIAPFIRLFGNSELAVRLPGALAALVFLWGVRALGRRLFDPGTALLGCWMTLASCVFLCRSRMAVPDMPAAAASILSAVWFLKCEKEGGFARALLFFLLCSAGFLLDGPTALLLPAAVVLPRLFSDERCRALLTWRTVAALAVALLVSTLLLSLPELLKYLSGRTPFQEFTLAFLQPLGYDNVIRPCLLPGGKIFWREWASALFPALMPWTPFLIAGWISLLKKRKALSPELGLTGIGMVVVPAVFGPFVFRGWDAALPLAPLFLLFGAAGLNGHGDPVWERWTCKILYYTAAALSSLFIGSLLAAPLWEKMGGAFPGPVPAFFPAAAGVLAWYGLFMDHREGSSWSLLFRLPHRLGAAVFAVTLLTGAVLSAAYPALEELREEKTFFRSAAAEAGKNELRPEQLRVYAGTPPAGYLFYNDLPSKLTSISSLREASDAWPGKAVVLFGNREKVQNGFNREIKALGITRSRRMALKSAARRKFQGAGNENYVVYTIEFPKKSTLKGAVQ